MIIMQRLLDIPALTDEPQNEDTHALRAVQYGVLNLKDKTLKVYGDQDWVKSGQAAADMGGTDGITMVREIHISYGPWKPAP